MPEARNKDSKIKVISGEVNEAEMEKFTEDKVWGFRITGGADFGMPITVFHVTEGGFANQAGIKLGDTVVNINGTNTKNMSLSEAHQRIQDAGDDLQLSVKNFEDEDSEKEEQEHTVDLGARKRIQKEDRSNWIQQPERKVWHPIVWQQPPPPIPPEMIGKDAPHKRIINNIYRFFRDYENNPEFRQKTVEDMLLALPTITKQ